MKIDCQWVSTNLEAIACETLTADQARMAKAHIDACANCRSEMDGLEEVDLLVKKYMRHQLAIAQTHVQRRFAWGYVGTAAAVVASLVLAVSLSLQPGETDLAQPAAESAAVATPAEISPIAKETDPAPVERAKPADAAAPAMAEATPSTTASNADAAAATDFLVTDPAGYSRTLQDYRGYVLFFGVWAPNQPEAAANIERLYQRFGSTTKLRIIGITDSGQPRPANTTFPLFYNRGSRLLNTAPGQFVILDSAGSPRLRGSLLTPSDDFMKVSSEALQPLLNQ